MFGSSVKNLKRSIRAAENQKLRGEGVAVKPATVVVAPTSRRAKVRVAKKDGAKTSTADVYLRRLRDFCTGI